MRCCRPSCGGRPRAAGSAAVRSEPCSGNSSSRAPDVVGLWAQRGQKASKKAAKVPPKKVCRFTYLFFGPFWGPFAPRSAVLHARSPSPERIEPLTSPHVRRATPDSSTRRVPRAASRLQDISTMHFSKNVADATSETAKRTKNSPKLHPKDPIRRSKRTEKAPREPQQRSPATPRAPSHAREARGRANHVMGSKIDTPRGHHGTPPRPQPPPPGLPALDNLNALTSPPCSAPHADAPLPGSADLGGWGLGGSGAGAGVES